VGADPADPRFRVGINYWPMRTAMRWWAEFVRAEVDEDFARIAGGGFDSVRCFLLWEAFQPAPDRVDTAMLERLVSVADAAEHAGLAIVPTLFAGHMSGVDWIPGWALGGTERDARFRVVSGGRVVPDGVRNWYADPDVVQASGGSVEYLATGESTGREFGLYRWNFGTGRTGPDPHFHRTISESFFILDGTVTIYDGGDWVETRAGDFAHHHPHPVC